ncbi:MAG TPA: hypothetical protein VFQ53_00390 [Kofleriaceae bacterium]|nr:hypothetical protein [Kofleriaceae bacterium]
MSSSVEPTPDLPAPASPYAADAGLRPPILVFVDADGTTHVAAAHRWRDLDAGIFATDRKRLSRTDVQSLVSTASALGEDPVNAVRSFEPQPAPRKRTGATPSSSGVDGDPLHLEDGIQGRRDDPRPTPTDAQRLAGPRGVVASDGDAAERKRHAWVTGEIADTGRHVPSPPALVIADPRAPAIELVAMVMMTEGAIGVRQGNAVQVLRLQFKPEHDDVIPGPPAWIELQVRPDRLVATFAPGVSEELAWQGGALDHRRLARVLATIRRARDLDAHAPVDVLVGADTSTQRLVDVLVALDQAGEHMIGLGAMSGVKPRSSP